jgi:hypothetical protein
MKLLSNIRDSFICWFSNNFWNIHTEEDSWIRIPDKYKEYRCKRCSMIYKL